MHNRHSYREGALSLLRVVIVVLLLGGLGQPVCGAGVEYVIAVQPNPNDANGTAAHTAKLLQGRLTRLGFQGRVLVRSDKELVVQAVGIALNEPGETNLARTLQRSAFVTIRQVHPESDLLTAQGIVDPGYQIMEEHRENPDGTMTTYKLLVTKKPANGLTSQHIRRAGVTRDPNSEKPEVNFEFDSEGKLAFAQVTRDLQPRGGKRQRLAIVIDDVVYSAPYVNEPIEGGRVRITGSFSLREAFELANVLENPIGTTLTIIAKRSLSPEVERELADARVQVVIRAAFLGAVLIAIVGFIWYSMRKCAPGKMSPTDGTRRN